MSKSSCFGREALRETVVATIESVGEVGRTELSNRTSEATFHGDAIQACAARSARLTPWPRFGIAFCIDP